VLPNRDLTERVATLPYLSPDHYESTHDECDTLSAIALPDADGLPKRLRLFPADLVEKFQFDCHATSDEICDSREIERFRFMQDDYIECPELSGKTIQTFRIHKDTGDGTNLQIELSDGTSFSCCLNLRPDVKASLYRGGVGTPETIRNYEI